MHALPVPTSVVRAARAARTYTSALCAIALCAVSAADAQSSPSSEASSLSTGAVVGQVASGVGGTVLGFVIGGLVTRRIVGDGGGDADAVSRVSLIGAFAGAALGTGVGPALIGSRDAARGSYPAAVGGAVAGGAVSLLLKRAGERGAFGESGPRAVIAGIAILAMPSIGATLAYNATRRTR